jgi:hypothetical protein
MPPAKASGFPSSLWQLRVLAVVAIFLGIKFLLPEVMPWVLAQPQQFEWSQIIRISGAVLYFVCGIGLLALRNWARYVLIGLMAWLVPYVCMTFVAYIDRLLRGATVLWHFELLAFLIVATGLFPFSALWILTRPDIVELFRKRSRPIT